MSRGSGAPTAGVRRGAHASRARPATRPAHRRRAAAAAGPHRVDSYPVLVATVTLLNVIGAVMVLSASSVVSLTGYGSAWYFFQRQLAWIVLGIAAFAVATRVDYRHWQRLARPLLLVAVVLLLLVLVPGVGVHVAGSRRWLGVGALRFQPTEVAKLAVLLFSADLLTRRAGQLFDWTRVLLPVVLALGTVGTLVLLEPDLDSAVVLALIVAAVLVAGGVRMHHLAVVAGTGIGAAALLAMAAPYRRARVLVFLHPTADPSNTGYQIVQSLIALGSGGVTGVGLGAGRSKWHFLPNAHTDFIFSVIGEELGLVGCLAVLALFGVFAVVGLRIALHAPDRFGTLVAAGVTIWVVGQAAINVGGVVGLLPVSGIPLPFVSFGGSSLVFTMFAAGLLASVARSSR